MWVSHSFHRRSLFSLIASSYAQPPCIRARASLRTELTDGDAEQRADDGSVSGHMKCSFPGPAVCCRWFLFSSRLYGCEVKADGRQSVPLHLSALLPAPLGPHPAQIHKMADMIELGPAYGESQALSVSSLCWLTSKWLNWNTPNHISSLFYVVLSSL